MKTSSKQSLAESLPLDAVVLDFIKFLIYENPDIDIIHTKSRSAVNYKRALSSVIYDNTIGATMEDIALYTNTTNRSILDRYFDEHHEKMNDEVYQDIYLDMLLLLDKYRDLKQQIYDCGEMGNSYAKYGSEPLATCAKTGKPIRLGDFVASSTQGRSQFKDLPLIEIGKDIIGVHNHKVNVPLKPTAGYSDIINWEKIYLTKQSPLSWRIIL